MQKFNNKNKVNHKILNFKAIFLNWIRSDYKLLTINYKLHMASRTNKQWIAKKKAVQSKQANRLKWMKKFEYPKRKLTLEEAKDLWVIGIWVNPKWHEYNRFLRWRKMCRETRLRMDPDGYRYIRTPAGWSEMVEVWVSGRSRSKLKKNVGTR